MTNWPEASAVASATVLPASRSSTFSFGAARPAMTASPEGSTFTTSNAGSGGELAVGAAWLGSGALVRRRRGLGRCGSRKNARRLRLGGSIGHDPRGGGVPPEEIRMRPVERAGRSDNHRRGDRSDPNQRILRPHAYSLSPPTYTALRSLRQMSVAKPSLITANSVGACDHDRAAGASSSRPWALDLRANLRQRVEREVGALAAQPQVAKRTFGDSRRQFEADRSGPAEASTRSPVCRQSSWIRAAVLTVSPRKTISLFTEPISPVTTGPQ